MIWNGKRVKGVQVYRGRKGSEFAGEYIVIYFCNGFHGHGMVECRAGLQAGNIWPNMGTSVHTHLLSDWKAGGPYVRLSYRQLSEEARRRLENSVID